MDSLRSSWEATDEHGTTLFFLTFEFFALTLIAGSLMSGVIFDGNPVAGTIGAGLVEYICILPFGSRFGVHGLGAGASWFTIHVNAQLRTQDAQAQTVEKGERQQLRVHRLLPRKT